MADDFGYCECRSVGIAECCSVVTAVSVLVTAPPSLCSVPSGVAVGLHLNLTEGRPLSSDVPSLVDPQTGLMRGKMGVRHESAPAEEDVRREVLAQLRLFEERFGRLPAHVDGHQHVHLLPVVALVLAPLLREAGIRTRLPRQLVSNAAHPWVSPQLLAFFELINREAASVARVYDGVRCADRFIGLSTQGGMATRERVLEALSTVAEGESVEWMVHPGNPCDKQLLHCGDDFNASSDRRLEKQQLLDMREEIERLGFDFVSNLN